MTTFDRSVRPLECIVPPHMLDVIELRGDEGQRKMVKELRSRSTDYRDAREVAAPPGAFRGAAPAAAAATLTPRREVYDAGNRATLPGRLVRSEGEDPTGDAEADAAFDGAGYTYRLFADVYSRDSLDGQGMTLVSSVHVRRNFNNAFWNGEQMAYGDGDGKIFLPFTRSLSVIGHELSHGVVEFSGGLIYQDQSGALNESCADVFGCLVVQHHLGQSVAEASWLVGDNIFAEGVTGDALRSMRAPGTAYDDDLLGKDPQPFHMSEYVVTSSDHGGVHINSGIPNHAFYLLANYLGGNAWEKAGAIWYDALQAIQNPHATFAAWAAATVEQARNLFGSGSLEERFTTRVWKLVGVSF